MAIEHADFDGIERLALVTGGEIVSTFGNPELVKIGKCDLIEQVRKSFWFRLKQIIWFQNVFLSASIQAQRFYWSILLSSPPPYH